MIIYFIKYPELFPAHYAFEFDGRLWAKETGKSNFRNYNKQVPVAAIKRPATKHKRLTVIACKLLAYLTSGLLGFFWNVISYYFESEQGLPPFEAWYFCKRVRECSARAEYRARYYRGFIFITVKIVSSFSFFFPILRSIKNLLISSLSQ